MFNPKSIKSKIFFSYSAIIIIVIILSNIMFYFLSKRYFYNYTIDSLKSISRDVYADDIKGKNLKNGITLAVHKYKFSIPDVYIQARYKNKIVLKSKNLKNFSLPNIKSSIKGNITITKINNSQEKNKFIIYSVKIPTDSNYTVQIATTLKEEKHDLEKILHMFMIWDPIFIVIVLIIIYKMIVDILRPMNVIMKTAKNISATDLDKRIPYKDNNDEFAELAKTFNKMLSQLQASFSRIKRFNSDASHQLKTPLTSIRIQTDVVLKSGRDKEDYEKVLKSIRKEIIYLQEMINNLFLLTQMDDKSMQKKFKTVSLDTVLLNTVEEFVAVANKKGVVLNIENIENTSIKAENTLISILFSNLIDNAIKYTPAGKKITIRLQNNTFVIKDEGIGIENKYIDQIFEKFFRVHSSRSDKVKGYGLGLSIVKIIANLHNAKITIKSKINYGTKIKVYFTV